MWNDSAPDPPTSSEWLKSMASSSGAGRDGRFFDRSGRGPWSDGAGVPENESGMGRPLPQRAESSNDYGTGGVGEPPPVKIDRSRQGRKNHSAHFRGARNSFLLPRSPPAQP